MPNIGKDVCLSIRFPTILFAYWINLEKAFMETTGDNTGIPEAGYFEMTEHVRFNVVLFSFIFVSLLHMFMIDSHNQPEGR